MALERALTTRDIVLFNVAAILGLRWISLAAAQGPSSLALWVLAALVFFVPQGFAVTALASALPEEGGLYVWTTKAFGPAHGFLAGWLYWASNILYFPTLTLSAIVSALYIFGSRYAGLEQNALYAALGSLTLLAIALMLNIVGVRSGRWLQNIGGLANWLPAVALLLVGVLALTQSGSATPLNARAFVPGFGHLATVQFFATLCFGFAGLELAPTMAGEVVDPRRTFPRAIVISGLVIAACYLLGTLCVLWALPPSQTSIIAGVNQAITRAGEAHGVRWLGSPVAILMTIAGLGGIGAWLVASARLLFVAGMDRYLPQAFGRTHPRWHTPYVALLVQAALSAVFIVAATRGDTVKDAYQKLVDATLIVYFIPYAYMFAAAIRLRTLISLQPAAIPVPGGRGGSLFWNGLGFVTTLVSIALALVPPADAADPRRFFIEVLGGSAGFTLAGVLLYLWAARRRSAADAVLRDA